MSTESLSDKETDRVAAVLALGDIVDGADCEEFTRALLEEVDYLRYFYAAADFGPAHADVVAIINEAYEGKIPEEYREEEEE